MTSFAGRWLTTFGPMELQQADSQIQGTYTYKDVTCSIHGTLQDERFVFRYQEPAESGEGWFEQPSFGQMRGQYRPDGGETWRDWSGDREWNGIWETSFGRMRLIQEVDRVHGFYDGVGPSRVEGRVYQNRYVFRYYEPAAQGEGWFELADDAQSFSGNWQADGAPQGGAWIGRRLRSQTGITWLMVIEAHWQRYLADNEYSYGHMLKEFFARLPHVAVRHRFFNDETSLERWCREMIYFPEPAIIVIASHGTAEGVTVHGQTINTRLVIDSMRHANNIQLVHFSACLVMQEEQDGDFARRVGDDVAFPISGYTTSVDWGGSAIVEFNYLDMILGKGLRPEQAASMLLQLNQFAGDQAPQDSPYPAAGFRFFKPGKLPAAKPARKSSRKMKK